MIFEALQGLAESIRADYRCPDCNSNIGDGAIDIIGAAGNTVNFDVACSNCGKHSMIKSQLLMIDQNGVAQIKHTIEDMKNKQNNKNIKITDSEIINLNNDLKNKNINVSDLFN